MQKSTGPYYPGCTTSSGPFGIYRKRISCPYCHHEVTTKVKLRPKMQTHLYALLMCVCSCWLCCCIPYCLDVCQYQLHYCPTCNAFIGSSD